MDTQHDLIALRADAIVADLALLRTTTGGGVHRWLYDADIDEEHKRDLASYFGGRDLAIATPELLEALRQRGVDVGPRKPGGPNHEWRSLPASWRISMWPPNQPCDRCLTTTTHSPETAGELLSRDHQMRPVSQLTEGDITAKAGEPRGWLHQVLTSVLNEGFLQPILLTTDEQGRTVLIDGVHRAWIAWEYGKDVPAQVFSPTCGRCTEQMVREAAMQRTRALNWAY